MPDADEYAIETAAVARALKEHANARTDALVRAIRETDWTETDILDVVERHRPRLHPLAGNSPPDPTIEVYRYTRRAPPLREYADGTHRLEVYRLTEPLLDRIGVDPDHPEQIERDLEATDGDE